ncbi:uncharacterized protein At4g15545-like [Benincasa hispida]|uniref:uncharacterized protein At4g15545-like n=1 Tax=Benincasa hispida TaxID=102211 RepID=UPI001901E4B3|nr:uncharacterized protein At4g15545-like [Benincasa hispida]XP_038880311.1 uncharacterized protein At4g15545-like [Benincasa hispida]
MQGKESGASGFALPDGVLQVLPSDPFEQLDVARKITSIALSTRVSLLESESSVLRSKLAEKDEIVADLRFQIESLNASLSEIADKLAQAEEKKESLEKENASLSNTVMKLSRDVAKLEVFRKTLMLSLQEEGDSSTEVPEVVARIQNQPSESTASQIEEEVSSLPPSRYSSVQSQVSEVGSSLAEDHDSDRDSIRPRIAPGLLLASQTSTPRFTPYGSPSLSASVSPMRTSRPVSPGRHSMSFSTSRNIFEDRSSVYSSAPSSHYGSISSNQGRTRVDGKEFFRQVRSRLSYEQFAAFLANVKDLNSHKQTKEETLQKAEEILGHDNKDLYAIFEGLINRNLP